MVIVHCLTCAELILSFMKNVIYNKFADKCSNLGVWILIQGKQRCHLYIFASHHSRDQFLKERISSFEQILSFMSRPGPEVIKLFFMLNSVEHEILNAHKYKNIKNFGLFSGLDKPRMLFFPLINVKMPTVVGILTFMSRKNFMLS